MADLKLPRLNKIFIAGRITHDLELKYTPKGTPVLRFSLASDRRYKDDTGEWQTQTTFVDIVVWSYAAENIHKQAKKGTAVLVEGRLEIRSYVDQNNQNRRIAEIVADNVQTLEWGPRDEGTAGEDIPLPQEPQAPATKDDVPF
ncbi:MAG: single-stranded DNA-binding protein [Candidatus Cloacimonetes bacterium]|nr:single-stranded DNA-binding protein [Candidatus Cloacimonadota bacterium]